MTNFLSTGVSGLLAFQRALEATSQNIANVSTPGYSRQRAEMMTRPASPYANGWVGNGVQVTTTRRIYDDLLAQQVRNSSSTFTSLDTFVTQMNRVNNLFSSTTTGLTATVQKFANALQDVANTPTSQSARQVLLSEANGLAQRLKTYESELASYDRQIEQALVGQVSEISTLASGIAQLNADIAGAYARYGQPPNDLLDQRDRLLDQLSTHVDLNTVAQPDGQVNVFVGSGQPLVVGANAAKMTTIVDPYDPGRHGVALQLAGGNTADITSSISGGTLGGLLEFRTQVLDPTRNSLGRISVALATTINEQHQAGMDLSGTLGGKLFGLGGVLVSSHNGNDGDASLAVTRANIGALTEGDYYLERTTTGWALTRVDTRQTVPMTGDGSAADPLMADGLAIEVSGTAEVGDRFLIRPTRAATAGLDVLISDPSKIAAAAPIRTSAGSANTGTGTISAGSVVDAGNADLRNLATIEFTSPTTFTINGMGPGTYTPGQPIELNGWRVEISGTPATGDTFTVRDNTNGSGDNRNALELADSLARQVLDNGTTSVNDATTRIVGSIGVATRQAQASRDAQSVIQQESVDARDAVSGVNLDEEAANLIRYQQAYQAAAQLIQVANSLFDSLLAATSRR